LKIINLVFSVEVKNKLFISLIMYLDKNNIHYNKVSQGNPKFSECNGLQTTMIYTHVMNKGPMGLKSPGDSL